MRIKRNIIKLCKLNFETIDTEIERNACETKLNKSEEREMRRKLK